MAKRPDKSNAHVRTDSKRESHEAVANEAQRLLDDPAYKRGVEICRESLVRELESIKADGSEAQEDFEREICRSLRSLKSLRHAIAACVQGQSLREAGFRPVAPEKE